MDMYVVQQGECLSSIAFDLGYLPETIWNHPSNRELRRTRKDSNILNPGDELAIPDKRLARYSRPTDARHKFVVKGFVALCRLQVCDGEEPRAKQNYVLAIEGLIYSGVTDEQGKLEHPMPPNARKGSLTIGPGQMHYDLEFGDLDPVQEISGVQGRLANLGYYHGEITGEMDDPTQWALRAFQHRFGLNASAEIDDETQRKLQEIHDRVSLFPEQTHAPAGGSS